MNRKIETSLMVRRRTTKSRQASPGTVSAAFRTPPDAKIHEASSLAELPSWFVKVFEQQQRQRVARCRPSTTFVFFPLPDAPLAGQKTLPPNCLAAVCPPLLSRDSGLTLVRQCGNASLDLKREPTADSVLGRPTPPLPNVPIIFHRIGEVSRAHLRRIARSTAHSTVI
eukprot:m.241231 g.241231  ORF g.241231 m.241231 type:complete len:169 (-) comp54419_c0_seq1:342-848(-)